MPPKNPKYLDRLAHIAPKESQAKAAHGAHYRHDNQCYPPEVPDLQFISSYLQVQTRETGTTRSDKSLTAATVCCCSFNSGIKVYTLPNLSKL